MRCDGNRSESPRKPPLKLPRLSATILLMAPTIAQPGPGRKGAKSTGEASITTTRRQGIVGKNGNVPAAHETVIRRRRSMPTARADEASCSGRARQVSPARRGSLIRRRRSGDFSLPVRYKYVVIPGNNSRAVLAAFRRRPWWGPARKDEGATVGASNVQRGKKGTRCAIPREGYSNSTFNLWWEMYASRPVIEGANSNVNVRQAVNHFEFNATLVSKKRNGVLSSGAPWVPLCVNYGNLEGAGAGPAPKPESSLRIRGVPAKADIVPETFYLYGAGAGAGAPRPDGSPREGRPADERAQFLEFCSAMVITDAVPLSSTTTDEETRRCGATAAAAATAEDSSSGGGSNRAAEPSRVDEIRSASPLPLWSAPPNKDAPGAANTAFAPKHGDLVVVAPEEGKETPGAKNEQETPAVSRPPTHDRARKDRDSDKDNTAEDPSGSLGTPKARATLRGSDSPPSLPQEGTFCSPGIGPDHPVPDGTLEGGSSAELSSTSEGEFRENETAASGGGSEKGVAVRGGAPTWVVKPAANSNCGFGIQVCCSKKEVLGVVDDASNKAGRNGWIVQRYIERPLLVRGRKFDIRLFVLLVADPSTRSWRRRSKSAAAPATAAVAAGVSRSSGNSVDSSGGGGGSSCDAEGMQFAEAGEDKVVADGGSSSDCGTKTRGETPAAVAAVGPCPLTAWCHRNAYIRTSSVKYSSDPSKAKDRFVHLTNNAVQRRSPSYGQDEPGNKLTLVDLQDWLDRDESSHKGDANGWVEDTLRPRMNDLVATSVAAAAAAGINKRGQPYAFELLGYDFMVDDDLRVWLIEVNSNPCLEFVCPLLQEMIVRVIDDTLSVALDPLFPPPEKHRPPTMDGTGCSTGDDNIGSSGFTRVYPVVK